jgi:hypothetical protein
MGGRGGGRRQEGSRREEGRWRHERRGLLLLTLGIRRPSSLRTYHLTWSRPSPRLTSLQWPKVLFPLLRPFHRERILMHMERRVSIPSSPPPILPFLMPLRPASLTPLRHPTSCGTPTSLPPTIHTCPIPQHTYRPTLRTSLDPGRGRGRGGRRRGGMTDIIEETAEDNGAEAAGQTDEKGVSRYL